MIFNAVVIIFVGVIAYFHYVQGLFSATLSAILAILAAVIAISYQEVIVRYLGGKVPDEAAALVIVALFAVTYTIMRVIFDAAVPGNIRLPVLLDKVGAGLVGIVAGIFAVGVLVVAAQTLPMGPEIAGYSRYKLVDNREVQIPGARRAVDSKVYDILNSDTFVPEDKSGLILPVDDMVVNLTTHLSDGGALAGPVDLAQAHPAYLDELFGQRLGVQTGAKHVAVNLDREKDVDVRGIYAVDSRASRRRNQRDSQIRRRPATQVGSVKSHSHRASGFIQGGRR